MSTPTTKRSAAPWRWSVCLLVVGLVVWGAAEYRSGLYAWNTSADHLDAAGRIAFAAAAGLGSLGGGVVTVWLFTGGKRQRRQAALAGLVTTIALVVACWNLSAATALPRMTREAEATTKTEAYAQAKLDYREASSALAAGVDFEREETLKAQKAEAAAIIRKGDPPVYGYARWDEWLLAALQHLLAIGFAATFRVPIPTKEPKAKPQPKTNARPRTKPTVAVDNGAAATA